VDLRVSLARHGSLCRGEGSVLGSLLRSIVNRLTNPYWHILFFYYRESSDKLLMDIKEALPLLNYMRTSPFTPITNVPMNMYRKP
jgi:hypothetical protein